MNSIVVNTNSSKLTIAKRCIEGWQAVPEAWPYVNLWQGAAKTSISYLGTYSKILALT